jgi:hypothetical protein
VLLVHAGGQMAAIGGGGLVHISRGMSHTFATTRQPCKLPRAAHPPAEPGN